MTGGWGVVSLCVWRVKSRNEGGWKGDRNDEERMKDGRRKRRGEGGNQGGRKQSKEGR